MLETDVKASLKCTICLSLSGSVCVLDCESWGGSIYVGVLVLLCMCVSGANFLCIYSSVLVSYINQIKKSCNIVLLGYL